MNAPKGSLGVRLKWLGCACFELDFGGTTVVNDPWITDNTRTDLTWEAVEKCDYITLTHSHFDHITDIPALVKKFDPYVFCGEQTAIPLMDYADLNPMKVYPMYPDTELDMEQVKIKALYGRHTPLPGTAKERLQNRLNSSIKDDPTMVQLAVLGDFEYRNFLFTTPAGVKVLIWGNMISRPDQRSIMRQVRPDVALVQMTGRNDPAQMAQICAEIGCKVVLPNHIDFPKTMEDYAPHFLGLGEELARIAPEIRYIVPEYGQWIEL